MARPEALPFYLSRREFADFRRTQNILPTDLYDGYRAVEAEASIAFLELYGEHLDRFQEKYFTSEQIIFTGLTNARRIEREANRYDLPDHPDTAIDGIIYDCYRNLDCAITPYLSVLGNYAIYPLRLNEVHEVSPDLLGVKESKKARATHRPMPRRFYNSAYCHSNELASAAVHEKAHGVQDMLKVPLPILEAAAVHYERSVIGQNGWHYHGQSNMDNLADLFKDCVGWFGKPLHRLVFGNYDRRGRGKLLAELKSVFSSSEIDRLSRRGPKSSHIIWKKKRAKPELAIGTVGR